MTATTLCPVEDDLGRVVERESLLLQADVRRDRQHVLLLLHPDFTEFGASGRIWSRDSISEVTDTATVDIEMSDIEARQLGPEAVLLTYQSHDGDRHALRCSTWVKSSGTWLLLFHQGTLVADA